MNAHLLVVSLLPTAVVRLVVVWSHVERRDCQLFTTGDHASYGLRLGRGYVRIVYAASVVILQLASVHELGL